MLEFLYDYLPAFMQQWSWKVWAAVWVTLNCGPMWYVVWNRKKIRPTKEHRANPKFKAFLRLDVDSWSYLWTFFTHSFYWVRFFLAVSCIFITLIGTRVCQIGLKSDQPPGKIRLSLYSAFLWIGCRLPLYLSGVLYIDHRKKNFCYKKWLGPEWKYDKKTSHEGAGIYVANHQTFCDIFLQLSIHNPCPGFVAKSMVKKVPLIGPISDKVLNCLYVERVSKESKAQVFNKL